MRKVRVQTLRTLKNRKVCTRTFHTFLIFGNFNLKTKYPPFFLVAEIKEYGRDARNELRSQPTEEAPPSVDLGTEKIRRLFNEILKIMKDKKV